MALTRNQQRAIAKERAKAKALRIYNRDKALVLERNLKIVATPNRDKLMLAGADTIMTAEWERARIGSCLADMKGQSHRAYICRAAGAGKKK